ncbi:Ankyrin-1 [Sesbania bispinosa]|nr:Ankyrin-1 [Sesbania bispinosa]
MRVIGIQRQQRKTEACMSQLWPGWVRMVTAVQGGDATWVLLLDGGVQRSIRVTGEGVSGEPSSICSLYSSLTMWLKPMPRGGGPVLQQSTSTAVRSIATEQPVNLQV